MAVVFGRFLLWTSNPKRRLLLARCQGGSFFPLSVFCQKSLCGGTTETIPGSFLSEVHRSSPLLKGWNSWNGLNPVNKGVVLVLFLHMAFSKPGMKISLIRWLFGETKSQRKENTERSGNKDSVFLLLKTCLYHHIMSWIFLFICSYSAFSISLFYFHLVKIPEIFGINFMHTSIILHADFFFSTWYCPTSTARYKGCALCCCPV